MSDSPTGGFSHPIIDGYLLDQASISEEDFTQRKLKEVVPMGPRGGAREALAYQGAGFPMMGIKHDLTLRYAHLRSHYDQVEEMFNAPGPHGVVIWKRVHPAYAGDGSRATFHLPWLSALDFYDVPGPLSAGADGLAVEARIGTGWRLADGTTETATTLTVLVKSESDYGAGSPAAGEAWFLEEGREFKVGTVPLAGERLYVRMVPVIQLFEQGIVTKRYTAASTREPRDIVLVER